MNTRIPDPLLKKLVAGAANRHAAVVRDMTNAEITMALHVASCPLLSKSKHRGSMRLLHARSLTVNRHINEVEAATLRACVLTFRAQLPANVVELAERRS